MFLLVIVSECSYISTCRLLSQWATTIKIKIQWSMLVLYKAKINIMISLKSSCLDRYSHLALNSNRSLTHSPAVQHILFFSVVIYNYLIVVLWLSIKKKKSATVPLNANGWNGRRAGGEKGYSYICYWCLTPF
jgi:hypothetical protein